MTALGLARNVHKSCFYYPNVQDAFHSAGELQATLQEVDVPVVAAEECQRALRSEGLGRR